MNMQSLIELALGYVIQQERQDALPYMLRGVDWDEVRTTFKHPPQQEGFVYEHIVVHALYHLARLQRSKDESRPLPTSLRRSDWYEAAAAAEKFFIARRQEQEHPIVLPAVKMEILNERDASHRQTNRKLQITIDMEPEVE